MLSLQVGRIGILLYLIAAVAFTTALCVPAQVGLVGPLLFGILHVTADIRFLVLDQKEAVPMRSRLALAVGILAWICLKSLAVFISVPTDIDLYLGIVIGFVPPLLAAQHFSMSMTNLCLMFVAWICAWFFPEKFMAVLLYGHSLISIALGIWLIRRWHGLRSYGLPAIILAVLGVWLYVSPLLFNTDPAAAKIRSFVYFQQIHLIVWAIIIPLTRFPSYTLGQQALAFVHDFGRVPTCLLAASFFILGCAAMLNAELAKVYYLNFAGFHAWIEIAFVLCYFENSIDFLKRPFGNRKIIEKLVTQLE